MIGKRLTDYCLREYKLVHRNPIYVLELYWNRLYPGETATLSDKE